MQISKVLVTGAAGFVGSHLVERLLAEGRQVVGVDNFDAFYDPRRKRANLAGCVENRGFELHEADVRDAAVIEAIVGKTEPDAIAHLAAMANVRYSIGRAPLYTQVNLLGTVHLLEAARRAGVGRFVFASTSSVYGHTQRLPFVEDDPCNLPLAPYPASKKAAEVMGYTYHNLHGMDFTAVRFFSVYGPRGRPDMMPLMITDRIVKGETITLYDGGAMRRDWTYVGDIVEGVVAAIDRPLGYAVINLGRGEPVLMRDFVGIVEKLAGREAVLETPAAPPSEPKITFASIDRAREMLGYAPATPVEEGLAALWRWYRQEMT